MAHAPGRRVPLAVRRGGPAMRVRAEAAAAAQEGRRAAQAARACRRRRRGRYRGQQCGDCQHTESARRGRRRARVCGPGGHRLAAHGTCLGALRPETAHTRADRVRACLHGTGGRLGTARLPRCTSAGRGLPRLRHDPAGRRVRPADGVQPRGARPAHPRHQRLRGHECARGAVCGLWLEGLQVGGHGPLVRARAAARRAAARRAPRVAGRGGGVAAAALALLLCARTHARRGARGGLGVYAYVDASCDSAIVEPGGYGTASPTKRGLKLG
mmetsp:Transcript_14588/g.34677  ORF Transcript_14588/g.34677 Transcript_14588/m.34677 type:complete len:271 (-) Transcript_14588:167-979(-)